MPTSLINSITKKSDKPESTIESEWHAAKEEAEKSGASNIYAYATAILEKRNKDESPEQSALRRQALEKLRKEEALYNWFRKHTDKVLHAGDKSKANDSWAGDINAASNKSVYGTERSKREEDANEYLHVDDCILTGEQVAPYLGKEIDKDGSLKLNKDQIYGVLRPADEVKKAVDSFNGIPLTDGHIYITPAQPHQNRVVGYTGTDATFKDGKLFNSVHIHVGKAINDIKRADDSKGGKKDLSCGYTYDLVPEKGSLNGEPYQFKMVNIKGNHLALVEDGRHPEAMIADSNFKGNTKTMSKTKSWFSAILGTFAADDKSVIMDTAVELANAPASDFAGGEVEQAQRIIEVIKAYDEADEDKKVVDKKAKDKKAKDEDEEEKKEKEAEDEADEEETEKKAKDKKVADKKAKDKKAKDEDDEDMAEDEEDDEKKEKAMDEAIRARNTVISTAKKVIGMSDKFVESASVEAIVDNALTKNGLNIKGRAFDSKVAMLEVLATTKEQAKPAKRVAVDSRTNSDKYPSLINRKQ